jgi:hypothetical protein
MYVWWRIVTVGSGNFPLLIALFNVERWQPRSSAASGILRSGLGQPELFCERLMGLDPPVSWRQVESAMGGDGFARHQSVHRCPTDTKQACGLLKGHQQRKFATATATARATTSVWMA